MAGHATTPVLVTGAQSLEVTLNELEAISVRLRELVHSQMPGDRMPIAAASHVLSACTALNVAVGKILAERTGKAE